VLEHVVRAGGRRSRGSVGMLLAYLAATPVHLLFVVLIFFGVSLVTSFRRYGPAPAVSSLLFFALAWQIRPNPPKAPKGLIRRDQAPAFFQTMDRIRAQLGGPRVDRLRIDSKHWAAIGSYGLRRRKVVHLHPAYIAIMQPRELVGVLAHEQGHSVNGDPNRRTFVWLALTNLGKIRRGLLGSSREIGRVRSAFTVLTALGLNVIVWIVYALEILIVRVTWWERQSAELRADLCGARVVGADIAVRAHQKSFILEDAMLFMRGRCLSPVPNMAAELRATYGDVPDRALRRITTQLAQPDVAATFDASHPPARDRVALLERCRPTIESDRDPSLWSDRLLEELDQELRRLSVDAMEKLVEQFRAAESHNYSGVIPPWKRAPQN
jgi:Zn-dependent protease with chaperone function